MKRRHLVPIIAELAEPTPAQLSMLIGGAFAIVVPVYLIFCIFGYLQYGAAVKSDILDSLPDNVLMSVARVAIPSSGSAPSPSPACRCMQMLRRTSHSTRRWE